MAKTADYTPSPEIHQNDPELLRIHKFLGYFQNYFRKKALLNLDHMLTVGHFPTSSLGARILRHRFIMCYVLLLICPVLFVSIVQ